ncbi:Gp138 family membrane-puncturing spike protein [Yersinia pseudotuberculosis]|uniref:Gp138 family membrane-puncturing spike protein n=1 Tax=Yersinia pseudotuberculosis TaxID=633 RepID=UPI002D80F335|nr:Gp138 family membrane-puncturing spike protein [Yersinia pseudotuberculosis]
MANSDSKLNPMLAAMNEVKRSALSPIMVCLPGKIISYNSSNQRAQIECGIQRKIGESFVTIPVITNVPVKFSGSGNWSVFHELPAGTEGLIHFSHRAIDTWIDQGGPVAPHEMRMFAPEDAFFSPGYRSMQTVIPGLPASGVGMSNKDGSVLFHMNDDGITLSVGGSKLSLTADGMIYNGVNFTSNSTTTLNGSTEVQSGGLKVGSIDFESHVHGGVQNGNGSTERPK